MVTEIDAVASRMEIGLRESGEQTGLQRKSADQDDRPKKERQSSEQTLIVGAGPAGLTAALTLVEAETPCHVVEEMSQVGGIARTAKYKGYRFDIGGHRFFSRSKTVNELWQRMLGDDFLTVPRLSRIYYRNRFFDYPIKIGSTLSKLGIFESVAVMCSYVRWQLFPHKVEKSLEHWVVNRFGHRLFRIFFKTYTEKVWGMKCSEIRADWAAQRIKSLSFAAIFRQALTGINNTESLIEQFKYPRQGPGMMWERFAAVIRRRGGQLTLSTKVSEIKWADHRVHQVTLLDSDGQSSVQAVSGVISSMPLSELILSLSPPAPDPVLRSAMALKYRDFIIVVLMLNEREPFEDNWVYIHSPEVKVGRIQNFGAWSAEMVPDEHTASIGMEYFCHEGDGLWEMSDDDLIEQAKVELEQIGLAKAEQCFDGTVIRQVKAYPVYDAEYEQHVNVLKSYLQDFTNLQTIGRNGLHRYNNQDHSMMTGILAAKNLLRGDSRKDDVWSVNMERSYHEEIVITQT